jgi:hypothetical protein
MNVLSRDEQIALISALTEGCSIRATERLTGIHRDTIMRLGVRVGAGCAALHDDLMQFVQVNRLELDELWSYVGKKQKRITPTDPVDIGDQYVFIGIDATRKAIISYRVGKRDGDNANAFVADLRRRIVNRPGALIRSGLFLCSGNQAVPRRAGDGHRTPVLSRCSSRGTAPSADRLSAAGLHVVCRARKPKYSDGVAALHAADKWLLKEAGEPCCRREPLYRPLQSLPRPRGLRITPAMAIGITDHIWTIGELIDAAENLAPPAPRPRQPFTVIQGGRT